MSKSVAETPDQPTYLEIGFEKGIPQTLDGEELTSIQLIENLNKIAGLHGIGRIDQVENRLVGIKSREIYEAPAATVLLKAHQELEYLVNTKDLMHFKAQIDLKYSELIYNGLWFNPLKNALDSFIQSSQQRVTGLIRLKLFKGKAVVVGRKSSYSLYKKDLATYETGDTFDHQAAPGFIKLFGLGIKSVYEIKD